MAQNWKMYLYCPHPFAKANRGTVSIEQAIKLVYGKDIRYEVNPYPDHQYEYHVATIQNTGQAQATNIAQCILAMHLQHIRQEQYLPWSGECIYELVLASADPPERVRAIARERDRLFMERMRFS